MVKQAAERLIQCLEMIGKILSHKNKEEIV
jgi:hypothetical protein